MSAVRSIHLTREEDAAIRERNAQEAESQGFPALADAIRARNTLQGFHAADNQWGWTK